MKMQEWLKITGMKQGQLAQLAGITNARMTRILKYGMIPHHDEMVKFYWITLGAVRPDDYYDLDTVPAELKPLLKLNPNSRRDYVHIDDIKKLTQRKRNRWKRSALDH